MDDKLMIHWLCQHRDMSSDDLTLAHRSPDGAMHLQILIVAACQVSFKLVVADLLKSHVVMLVLLN